MKTKVMSWQNSLYNSPSVANTKSQNIEDNKDRDYKFA